MVETPKTLNAPFLFLEKKREKYIFVVLVIENHEFLKKKLEFSDMSCNFYEFSE